MSVKYFSEMRTAAPEVPAPAAPPAKAPEAPAAPAKSPAPEAPSQQVEAPPSPERDAVKFKLQAEQAAKKHGFSVRVTISSSNKSMMISIDPGEDIITQRDALKLAVNLDTIDKAWKLMDEPLQKVGGSWGIKLAKVG